MKSQKIKKEKGITLIVLVITIIVLIILAGVSISSLSGKNGILTQATDAKLESEVTSIEEEIEYGQFFNEEQEIVRYLTIEEFNEKYPDIDEKYKNKLGLYREEPVYLGNENDEISKAAKKHGYIVLSMTEEEFAYYIELGILEDKVNENKTNRIGRELSTSDFPDEIQIEDKTYRTGWYLIGNYTEDEKLNNTYGSQLEKLGIEDSTHAPYLVNYDTGYVLSINGMIMYQAEVSVHTFQDNNFKLTNAITYVDTGSKKDGQNYGNLYSVSLYEGEIYGSWAKYGDNDGNLVYDENGALILDQDNSIPVLDVNEKYKIDDSFSINITIEGDIYQSNSTNQNYPSTIVALSDEQNKYMCWIGFYKGYMHVYSYKSGPKANYDYESSMQGFISIDISKYVDKKMNIQVIGERGKETKVYINGELIKTFQSGDEKFTYKYVTIGDLRVGRNLKFTGKIYNFAIYGVALTEEDILENYEEAKKFGL